MIVSKATPVIVTAPTAAACTTGGYTGDTYCTDCGVLVKAGTVIPAVGHSYTSRVTAEPTTSSEGVMIYSCDLCGHSYTRAIARLQDTTGHAVTENQSGSSNTPDTGKPYIKAETGKEGWDMIKAEADKTRDGDTIVVAMNGTSIVPGDVLDEIKGKDVTIVFDMGNGITWSVNGQSITGDRTGDIDFTVTVNTNTIPIDIINNVTGELEFICADEIAEDGTAELIFTHASDYTIVVDKEPMDGSAEADSPASENSESENSGSDSTASESQATEAEAAQTGTEQNQAWNPWWIIVIGIMVIVIGLGVFFAAKKKKAGDK